MLRLVALLGVCLFSSLAIAACEEADIPNLPHPEDVGEYEMLQAQFAVKQYLAEQKMFLSCVQNGRRHNKAVDRMHEVANQYNRSAKRFKARMESLNRMTELAFLSVNF